MASLPATVRAFLFDMDGVLTDTARVHATAWKELFDAELERHAALDAVDGDPGDRFRPFDAVRDYHRYVDGKPRADGVRSFLASRGIVVPEGHPDDPPSADTVAGLGNRKNAEVQRLIAEQGVDVYADAVAFVRALRERDLPCAVVSSSANAETILAAAGIRELFSSVVDGKALVARDLPGKPAPDSFVAAASDLGADVTEAVVFEDAIAGVASGKAGGFGCVVGIDRVGQADALRDAGADLVISDFSALTLAPQNAASHPGASA
ncbi:MAG: beta-phosphoglucomutase family hydrolase [Patulibacter sp.]|nr:beta-phosphoglucomutase family hydrolase [Patulibacter sp.]